MSNILIGKLNETVNLQIVVGNNKKYIILLLSIIFCFVAPIIGIVLIILLSDLSLEFGYILTVVIFWVSGAYFLRLYLWNKYGKEVYSISKDLFYYYYDYKYFIDNKSEIPITELQIGYFEDGAPNDLTLLSSGDIEGTQDFYCVLGFYLNGEVIKSNTKVKYLDAVKVFKVINQIRPISGLVETISGGD